MPLRSLLGSREHSSRTYPTDPVRCPCMLLYECFWMLCKCKVFLISFCLSWCSLGKVMWENFKFYFYCANRLTSTLTHTYTHNICRAAQQQLFRRVGGGMIMKFCWEAFYEQNRELPIAASVPTLKIRAHECLIQIQMVWEIMQWVRVRTFERLTLRITSFVNVLIWKFHLEKWEGYYLAWGFSVNLDSHLLYLYVSLFVIDGAFQTQLCGQIRCVLSD